MLLEDKAGCLVRINSLYSQFTDAEKQVADHILNNDDTIYQTITHVAGASYGSIDRFCKKLGYSGFQDLKIYLAEDLAVRKARNGKDVKKGFIELAATDAKDEIDNTVQLLSEDSITAAARVIIKASFILVAGVSSSAGIASGIDYRLNRYGLRSVAYADNHLQRHRAASLKRKDVAILVSFSGSTREILATGRIVKEAGAFVISLTNDIESPVAELADISLVTGIVREPLSAEIASKVAVEFIVNLLFERIGELMKDSRSMLAQTFNATSDRQL